MTNINEAMQLEQPINTQDKPFKRASFLAKTYGLFIFPLPPNKKWIQANWHNLAVNNQEKLVLTFGSETCKNDNINLGIDLSKFIEKDTRLFALDFDVEKDKEHNPISDSTRHLDEFKDLIKKFKLPRTLTTRTASGGFHILFKISKSAFNDIGIKNTTKKNIPGYKSLDIITTNVVGPTSQLTNSKLKEYIFLDTSQIAEAPIDLLLFLKNKVFKKDDVFIHEVKKEFKIDDIAAKEQCIHYIINEAPRSIQGQGGDQTTLHISDALWDISDNSDIIEYALDLYNSIKCDPPWDMSSVEYKKFLRHPNRRDYRKTEAGEKGPKQFNDFPKYNPHLNNFGKVTIKRKDLLNVILARSNPVDRGKIRDVMEVPQRLFMVSSSFNIKGDFIDHHLYKNIIGAYELAPLFLKEQQTKSNYSYVEFTDVKKKKGSRTMDNVIPYLIKKNCFFEVSNVDFLPNFEEDIIHNGVYNTYNGHAIEYTHEYEEIRKEDYKPNPDAQLICERFFDILDDWSSYDESIFEWIFSWIAKRVQEPAWKPQTSIIIQGEYGSGKSIVFNILKFIMGTNLVRIMGNAELVNDFNGLNKNSLLTVFDEVDASTDHKTAKKLDAKIGNVSEIINTKGVDQIDSISYSGIAITCNEIPTMLVTTNQRRYQICYMSNSHAQDKNYFKPLFFANDANKRSNLSETEREGLALIHKKLLNHKGSIDVDKITFTKKSFDEYVQTLNKNSNGVMSWFITRVMQCEFHTYKMKVDEETEICIAPLWDDYILFCEFEDIEEPYDIQAFSKRLRSQPIYNITKVTRRNGTHKNTLLHYTDSSSTIHTRPYLFKISSQKKTLNSILKSIALSFIKNEKGGKEIVLNFLQDIMTTPPYSKLEVHKDEEASAEFEEFEK